MSSHMLESSPEQSSPDRPLWMDKIPVVFFGRLELRKGISTFVNAVKLLDPAIQDKIHIHFIGKIVLLHKTKFDDLQSDNYISQELSQSFSYTIHSNFFSNEAIKFIKQLDHPIICLASHQENFPNTGLEMGQLPITLVVSDTGGFRETLDLVNRNSGIYWFKPENSNSLSLILTEAIAQYPEEPEVADRSVLEQTNQSLLLRKLSLIKQALQLEQTKKQNQYTQPKVTIGITCYQLGRFLIECLTSVETQTYPNLEVIVLDDNSPDQETQEAVSEAKKLFPNFQFVISEVNLGLGGARNKLIELCNGEYFLPLDVDNRLLPFAVEKFVTAALQSNAAVVVSSMMLIGDLGGVHHFRYSSIASLLELNLVGDACSLFSTRLLKKFKHPQRRDCSTHDWCIIASAIAVDEKVIHYPYPLYEYRYRSDSLSRASTFSMSKERYYLRQYLAQIPSEEWSPRQIYLLTTAVQQLNAQLRAIKNE